MLDTISLDKEKNLVFKRTSFSNKKKLSNYILVKVRKYFRNRTCR